MNNNCKQTFNSGQKLFIAYLFTSKSIFLPLPLPLPVVLAIGVYTFVLRFSPTPLRQNAAVGRVLLFVCLLVVSTLGLYLLNWLTFNLDIPHAFKDHGFSSRRIRA